jgi:two-component system nitrate/nitrite response regulator NarL
MTGRAHPIRVLVADDHPILREGLRRMLEADPDFTIVGEATDGAEAVRQTLELAPDILLLDVAMPRVGGLEALERLTDSETATRVVLLTAAIEREDSVRALQLGARGIVFKETATELLYKCLRTVADGGYWVGHEQMDDIMQIAVTPRRGPADEVGPVSRLTRREMEIIGVVVEGATNKDIAATFGVSEQTVKNHLSNIFDKLGVSTRLELALYALHHRLLAGVTIDQLRSGASVPQPVAPLPKASK